MWQPVPIEYKRGKLRHEEGYEVQLCAQAMCLEEMLGAKVPTGALFYAKTRRRLEVPLTQETRDATGKAAARLHELLDGRITPPPEYGPKCKSCSLVDVCLPQTAPKRKSVARYLAGAMRQAGEHHTPHLSVGYQDSVRRAGDDP